MLIQQHRMPTPIRKMVSGFAYNHLLIDADSIGTRPRTLPKETIQAVPEYEHCPLLVANIESIEYKVRIYDYVRVKYWFICL